MPDVRLIIYRRGNNVAIVDTVVDLELIGKNLAEVCDQARFFFPNDFRPKKLRIIVDANRVRPEEMRLSVKPTMQSLVMRETESLSDDEPPAEFFELE